MKIVYQFEYFAVRVNLKIEQKAQLMYTIRWPQQASV